MTTQYPTSLDNFVNPTATDRLNSVTVPHHQQHADVNDAVEAIQTVLGLLPAGIHLTVKDRIIAAESSIAAKSVLSGLNDVNITAPLNTGDVLRYNGAKWANYNEKGIVDGGNF